MPIRFKGSARPQRVKSPDPANMPVVRENIASRVATEVAHFKANGELPMIPSNAVAYGIGGNGVLYEYDSIVDLWQDPTNLTLPTTVTNYGTSPIGWIRTHAFFALPGRFFAVGGDNRLYEAPTVVDLWNFTNIIDHGTSPVGWQRANEFFTHDGKIYGVALGNPGQIWMADDPLDLWNDINTTNMGTTAAGWNTNNKFIWNSEGLFGVGGSNRLYKFDTFTDMANFNPSVDYGLAPNGWGINNAFFSG